MLDEIKDKVLWRQASEVSLCPGHCVGDAVVSLIVAGLSMHAEVCVDPGHMATFSQSALDPLETVHVTGEL